MAVSAAPLLSLDDVQAAARRIAGAVHRTPCWESRTFSELSGSRVWLKYENLQRTGSYKIRGALNRILTLPEDAKRRGVIAASAGNHAQGVAVAARVAGVPATIVMPGQAPLAKIAATREYGARVILHGDVFDEAHAEAMRLADTEGLTYVHPFDDPAVMAGQGTVALEILDELPELDTLVVPIGGGGLIAGCATVVRALRPGLRVVGVEPSGANAMYLAFRGQYDGPLKSVSTIADGLATRATGELTLPIVKQHVDDVITVDDDAIAEAVVLLMERAKTVSEPAGAVALAAIIAGLVGRKGERVCGILSGGNVDLNLMDRILQYGFGAAGRHLRFATTLPDRPGALLGLSQILAEQGANIFQVIQHRVGTALSVNQVDMDLTLEVRDRAHGEAVLEALREGGYAPEVSAPRGGATTPESGE